LSYVHEDHVSNEVRRLGLLIQEDFQVSKNPIAYFQEVNIVLYVLEFFTCFKVAVDKRGGWCLLRRLIFLSSFMAKPWQIRPWSKSLVVFESEGSGLPCTPGPDRGY
jgi:hypothetical protein